MIAALQVNLLRHKVYLSVFGREQFLRLKEYHQTSISSERNPGNWEWDQYIGRTCMKCGLAPMHNANHCHCNLVQTKIYLGCIVCTFPVIITN